MPNKKSTLKKKRARAKTSSTPSAKLAHGAKAEFVRSRPETTVKELIALAKAQGMALTEGHVYNIRSNDRRRGDIVSSPTIGRARATNGAGASRSSEAGSLEPQLRTIILRMGLDRAEAIFSDVKSKLADVNDAPGFRPRRSSPPPAPSAAQTSSPTTTETGSRDAASAN